MLCVTTITLIGLARSVTLALVLVLAVSAARRSIRRPPLVHRFSGAQRGMAMSTHITSGTVGQAMAPLVFAPFVQQFGLKATPLLMIPALALLSCCCDAYQRSIDCRSITKPEASPRSTVRAAADIALPDRGAANVDCHELLDIRPCSADRRGLSLAQAGTAVSIYLIAVGLGGFIGGPSADRFGPRRVIILSLVSSVPFLMIAPMLHGWQFVVVLAIGDSCCNRRCRSTSRLRSSSRQSAQQRCRRS